MGLSSFTKFAASRLLQPDTATFFDKGLNLDVIENRLHTVHQILQFQWIRIEPQALPYSHGQKNTRRLISPAFFYLHCECALFVGSAIFA